MMPSEIKPGDLPIFDSITALAFEGIVYLVMSSLVYSVPAFGVPVLNTVIKYFVEIVLKHAWLPLQNFGAGKIIDAEQKKKAEEYIEAKDELRKLTSKPNVDLQSEEVKKAHEEFKKRLGLLIRSKPS